MPKQFFPHIAKLTHGLDHVSKGVMLLTMTKYWLTKGFSSYAQKLCQSWRTCAAHNAAGGVRMSLAAHLQPEKSFDHVMLDFIELSLS